MKKRLFFGICLLCFACALPGQDIHWRSLGAAQKNLLSLRTGLDYALVFGATYAHRLDTQSPVWVGGAWSVPSGTAPLDDWKLELNAQREIWHNRTFSVGLKPSIVLRRYESATATLHNIGAGAIASAGVFRPKWSLAAEAGYEGHFGTHIQHGVLKEFYPKIRDGWYGSTGGNLKFGLKSNIALRQNWGLLWKVGKPFAQNFGDNPTIPYYLDLAVYKCW